mmetsp:Transcript_24828/g.78189  ORF Transcript_24828/g.78189 Transcript_24828/m.78189 type:complete len:757 (-) Transcript_24828:81-2351(-)
MAKLAVAFALLLCSAVADDEARSAGAAGDARSKSLLQAWSQELDGGSTNPIWRVVGLLKDMRNTLQKEADEDQEHYDKLRCWCNDNGFEKTNAISDQEAKVEELEASIESLTAKSDGLKTRIEELNKEVADDKAALNEAMELREKQLKEFHKTEVDSIQAIENMKSALTVLAKHEDSGDGTNFKTESDSWSLIAVRSTRKDEPWSAAHEATQSARSLDDFMRRNGFDTESDNQMSLAAKPASKFLQHDAGALTESPHSSGWSVEESTTVRTALRSASAFMQAHGEYNPSYTSQSGEIVGILKQMKDEMEADLTEAQKRETSRASAFSELRSAKTSEIENGEKMSEQKEDEYATTKNNLAEAKEDLGQEQTALEENKKFMKTLKVTCKTADKDFEERKAARLEEIQAVSETIEILTREDKTREAYITTYSFFQRTAQGSKSKQQKAAAKVLRKVALAQREPRLSALATSVELDAFVKVKKAIDDMVGMLKVEMEDEVKKYDYCNSEIQENEIATTKAEDKKADLQAKSEELATKIKTLEDEISNAQKTIAQMQLDLQRASEDRKAENIEFQRVVGQQTVTIQVLKKALTKLSTFYNEEFFLQRSNKASKRQLPADPSAPPPQMEYSKSKAAGGVLEMMEKLIQEAKVLTEDSKKSEQDSQAAYEETVSETNNGVATLQEEVFTKTKAKAETKKEKLQTDSDIDDTVKEIEGLTKYNADLHGDCDYLLKNFNARQAARTQEIEALQQAKQILGGASLS